MTNIDFTEDHDTADTVLRMDEYLAYLSQNKANAGQNRREMAFEYYELLMPQLSRLQDTTGDEVPKWKVDVIEDTCRLIFDIVHYNGEHSREICDAMHDTITEHED